MAGGMLLLLAWIAKITIPYFFKKLDEKDTHILKREEYIAGLTVDFKKSIDAFLDANNHKTTVFTDAIRKLSESISEQNQLIMKSLANRGKKIVKNLK